MNLKRKIFRKACGKLENEITAEYRLSESVKVAKITTVEIAKI